VKKKITFAEQRTERLRELAAELVRLKVDLIVASRALSAVAAKGATTTAPAGEPTSFP
jgi:putative ABC transport system substrate-binding protein